MQVVESSGIVFLASIPTRMSMHAGLSLLANKATVMLQRDDNQLAYGQ